MFNVTDYIGQSALLEQCAEECIELAHACLKAARKLRNENPTPMTWEDISHNLNEETADVTLCITALVNDGILSHYSIDSMCMTKEERWEKRIKENSSKGE